MRRAACLVLPLLLALACGGEDRTSSTTAAGDDLSGSLTVLAAASLTDAFEEVVAAFEEAHAGVEVALSFDGSARLATAIIEGAPADVLASADEASLQRVADEGLTTGSPTVFATNVVQIVVPEGNPRGITTLDDLVEPGVRLSLCAPGVPCGTYADQAFASAGLARPAAGDQESVKGVLTQVQLGEADAGIVYLTDVAAAEGVEGIDLEPGEQVAATYPAAVLSEGGHPDAAAAFVAFLVGEDAQAIFERHGFGRRP